MAAAPSALPKTGRQQLRLVYFNIQGVAEKVRLALAIAGIPFEDVRVPFGEWKDLKPTTPYGQLPLLEIDGGAPIAQSKAMLRYAGRLATTSRGVPLYPDDKLLEIEEAIGMVEDVDRAWRPPVAVALSPADFGYPADFKGSDEHKAVVKAVREKFVREDLAKWGGILEKRLGGGAFLCGDTPTVADCYLVPILNRMTCGQVDHVPQDCLKPYPAVVAYVERFMAIPEVQAWYSSKE